MDIASHFLSSVYGFVQWRSPEEYFDRALDEKVDVFSLGNNMYSLLTGLQVFYDEQDTSKVQNRVKKGDKPYIDRRFKKKSIADAKLVEIIARCHEFDPADRPSIFEIVAFLTEALTEIEEDKGRLNLDKEQSS